MSQSKPIGNCSHCQQLRDQLRDQGTLLHALGIEYLDDMWRNVRAEKAEQEKDEILQEAARMVCGYCADPEQWDTPKRSSYPEWWHQFTKKPNNVRNKCSAWAIYEHIDLRRRMDKERSKRGWMGSRGQFDAGDE